MGFIFELSVIIKLFVIFLFIVTLIRMRLSLGTALMAGSILLGIWFRLDITHIFSSVIQSVFAEKTIMLGLLVSMILILSHSMEKTKQMERLLEASKGMIGDARLNLTLFPALIGLLPMPGGAIFSAPMVQVIGSQHQLSAEKKSLINYWFRHIWEYWWPLYPGVILTCSLSGIDLWAFIICQFSLTIVAIVAGYLFLLKPIYFITFSESYHTVPGASTRVLKELTPILIVITCSSGFRLLLPPLRGVWVGLETLPKETPLIIALFLSIMWVWCYNKVASIVVLKIVTNRSLLNMIYMVAGVFIFQGILEDSNAISEINAYLITKHIPIIYIVVILPFLVGWLVGIAIAFVGITFPILISLLVGSGMENYILPYVVLAYCSGFMGVLFSPLHFCLILTCEYFKADMVKIYKALWRPCLMVMASGLSLFFAIRAFLG